ncbi:MAG: bifunctional demethylmenaquinone methyltransferase/2-methoxy-6-polyprenyl-1,4-benzoquinol methylase UbiE [Archangiaceae bacterium]|nr:bifunctional demethylmenaquinone methyltransferase/2-methoxy-6-polyprenyl-1,4-benzoquinol methylase UbiE [Archangiaceae bacterium]
MSEQVQSMFSEIAPHYDLANSVLSLGTHRLWRRAAVKAAAVAKGAHVLDCATGTGDLAIAFKRAVGATGRVVGTDFCAEMLEPAPAKAAAAGLHIEFAQADAQALPYPDRSFDVASIAFGIRNVDDPVRCLRELARVVRPGGRVVVLELGQPRGVFGALFRVYSARVLPVIGGLISGRPAAYQYLDRTAAAFPAGPAFTALMQKAGVFGELTDRPLTFGTAHVYTGVVA